MKILSRLQTLDATRKTGCGNRAHRRLLSLFREAGGCQLEAVPSFRPQWLALAAKSPGTAEALAWRLSKLSNRPHDKQNPPSFSSYNGRHYEGAGCLARCQRAI